jgi:hypothetical protein
MNIPKLPNHIIMEILVHRKKIKYLDRKFEEAQMNKIKLLQEFEYLNEDLNTSLQIMLDNNDFDEEEIVEFENTPYSELLIENIECFNCYQKYSVLAIEDY